MQPSDWDEINLAMLNEIHSEYDYQGGIFAVFSSRNEIRDES